MLQFLKMLVPRPSRIFAAFRRGMGFFSRIGGKLAIISASSILLVLGIIACQFLYANAVHEAEESANRNQALVNNVLKIKSDVRGIQLGMTELRAAADAEDIQRAKKLFETQHQALDKTIMTAIRFVRTAQDRARIQKVNGLVDVYLAHTMTIEALKTEIFALQKKTSGPDAAESIDEDRHP